MFDLEHHVVHAANIFLNTIDDDSQDVARGFY